jgi:exosome complex RNA-binding protein Csl4
MGPIRLLLGSFISLVLATSQPAWAFKIVVPENNSKLKSGQAITAKVDLESDPGIVQVRYYWYGELDDVLVEKEETTSMGAIVARPTLVSTAASEPPYGGKLTVPPDGIGVMRLLAIGDISRGRLAGRSVFDEILVKVEPEAELTSIDFDAEKPLRFGRLGRGEQVDFLGKIVELPVVGLFADGVVRPIRLPATGTTYRSSNENVIKVHPDGMLQLTGNGRTVITAVNRGKQADLTVEVAVSEQPNLPPVANAGPDLRVKAGARVELNGLRSTDPEGEALGYSWSQVRGNKVALLDVNMPKATFVAPQVSEKRLFRFKLRVTDKFGADSLPAFVDVVVEP